MKKQTLTFCTIAMLAANSCAMAGVFTVISIVEGMEKTDPGLLVWLVCLALCHVALLRFLCRERSVRSVMLLCGAFFALQMVLVFALHGRFSGRIGILIAICMWLYSYYNCYELALKPLTAERLSKSFDLCSIVLIFSLFFCSVKAVPFVMLLPMAISSLLCLFALILIRGGGQRRLRSMFIAAVLIMVLSAFSALFVAVASGGVKKLVAFVTNAVLAVLRFILRIIDAVFMFIAGLFPNKEYDALAPELPDTAFAAPPSDMSFQLVDPEKAMTAMIVAGICLAAAFIIYRIVKGGRLDFAVASGAEKGLNRKRKGLAASLKTAFSRLIALASFRLAAIRARNTAPGLFWQLERRSRSALHGRGDSESCREFLMRAADVYPHACAELTKLADAMDARCFGGGDGLSTADIAAMRRIIFKTQE